MKIFLHSYSRIIAHYVVNIRKYLKAICGNYILLYYITHYSSFEMGDSLRNTIIDFIAGSLGGMASVYVGQPLDTVKVKMQIFPTLYTGMVDCFKKTLKNQGLFNGLFAGSVPALVSNVAENSVLFAGYGSCQRLIMFMSNVEEVHDLSVTQNAFAGSIASIGSSLAICPTELIKCKLQAMREMKNLYPTLYKAHIGPLTLTRQIIKRHGICGLFQGLQATIIREFPGCFFFFAGYEGTREIFRDSDQTKDDIGIVKTMIAGGVAGFAFWTTIFPIDSIKSRLQVTNVKTTAAAVFVNMIKYEGVFALYNGLVPQLIHTVPSTAVLLLFVEYSKKMLNTALDN